MIRWLSEYRQRIARGLAAEHLFPTPPVVEFRPPLSCCPGCGATLKVQKTHARLMTTLQIGPFRTVEVVLVCAQCRKNQRSEDLAKLAPPGANFGYDVLVYAGEALYRRHRNEAEVVAELAQKNVLISPREVSLLGRKFIVYLAIAHERKSRELAKAMRQRGGYICHLDGTCEGGDPFLVSSMDSLSEIVLGNVKLPSEDERQIAPFLQGLKDTFGSPLALVHDMGCGICNAVASVFPGIPDFICHFHFLRDIGKDLLGESYEIIRRRLTMHQIATKLRYHAKQFRSRIDAIPGIIEALQHGIENQPLESSTLEQLPLINTYSLILWTLNGRHQGDGYGFPFDRPHFVFALRLQELHARLDQLKDIQLRARWQDNGAYFKVFLELKKLSQDATLRKAVEDITGKIAIFDRLRRAMRIAPQAGRSGLRDSGGDTSVNTIKHRVEKFRAWLTSRKYYHQDRGFQNMIAQIDKYWEKLFADPITVQTPLGPIQIQPQRTNNIIEQFFRDMKRGDRRKTGNGSSSRMLRAMFAQTPLVKNLDNPNYMKILLHGKATLEDVFAEIEIATLRKEFKKAQLNPEKIPTSIKRLIALENYPAKLLAMVQKAVA